MPTIRLGGNRFDYSFNDVHHFHDTLSDKLDQGRMSKYEAVEYFNQFYLRVQSACYELENAMARRPDEREIKEYEKAYEAVDKVMSSIEQRMENVRLTTVTREHEQATRKLVDVREKIDTHSARISKPVERQQQQTPTNTYKPR